MGLFPVLPTPMTDLSYMISMHTNSRRYEGFCGQVQNELLNCLEAYGTNQTKTKCMDLLYDSIECKYRGMQTLRSRAIAQERMKKYREGKLEQPFEPHPPIDAYLFY